MAPEIYLKVLCLFSMSICCVYTQKGDDFGTLHQYNPTTVAIGGSSSSTQSSSSSYEPTSNQPASGTYSFVQTTHSLSSSNPVVIQPTSSNLLLGYLNSSRNTSSARALASSTFSSHSVPSERLKYGFTATGGFGAAQNVGPQTVHHSTSAASAAAIPIYRRHSQSASAQSTGALPYYSIPTSYHSAPGLLQENYGSSQTNDIQAEYGSGPLLETSRYASYLMVPSQDGVGPQLTFGSAQTIASRPYPSMPQFSYASNQEMGSRLISGLAGSSSSARGLGSYTNYGFAQQAGTQAIPSSAQGSSVLPHGLRTQGYGPSQTASGCSEGAYSQLGSGSRWVTSGSAPHPASQDRCGSSLGAAYQTRHGIVGTSSATQNLISQLAALKHQTGHDVSPWETTSGSDTVIPSGSAQGMQSHLGSGATQLSYTCDQASSSCGSQSATTHGLQNHFSDPGYAQDVSNVQGILMPTGQCNPVHQNLVSQLSSSIPHLGYTLFQGPDSTAMSAAQVAGTSYSAGQHATSQASYGSTQNMGSQTRYAFPQRYGMEAMLPSIQGSSGITQILSPLDYSLGHIADSSSVQRVQSQLSSGLISSVPSSSSHVSYGSNVGLGSQVRYGSTQASADHRPGSHGSSSTHGLSGSPTLQNLGSQMSSEIPLLAYKQRLVAHGVSGSAGRYTSPHSSGAHQTTGSGYVSSSSAHNTGSHHGSMPTGCVTSSQEDGSQLAVGQQMASQGTSRSGQGVGYQAQTLGFQLRPRSGASGWLPGSHSRKYWHSLLRGNAQ
ncbi:hornerin-like [Scleropages formosus]|uniref:hornerin-like n=1 Tax=Scleropages formosus TaxID=113540 RepID=UPI0010FABA65|nr:hornerin-like [Scleropages formosus]